MPNIKTVSGPGGRHYVHPYTGEVQPSVTTVLSVIDKPALVGWAAKSVAEYAADNMTAVAALGRDERVALLKGVPFRSRDKAASRGTDAHTYAENRLTFGIGANPSNRSEESVDAVIDALRPVPVFSEATVWNTAVGFAGTFDGIWLIDGKRYLIDWKSGKGVYPDAGLQIVAYSRGDSIITAGGVIDLPRIDGALIVHVPNDGPWSLHPVRLGEAEWLAFRAAKALWRWKFIESDLTLGQASQQINTRGK